MSARAHARDTRSYMLVSFMLVATSLVMLMTPGLAFFYGGLVGRKNVLTIMTQSFVSLGWTTVSLVHLRLLAVLQRE
jgi:ammonia channel protein AmtB